MKQGKTLIELATEISRQANARQDYVADTRQMEFVSDGQATKLVVGSHGMVEMNNHAHRQIGTHVGIPANYYDKMRKESPHLLADNVNHWFSKNPAKRMVRTMDDSARAFLSDRYRRIDNDQVLEHILPTLLKKSDAGDLRIVSCDVTETKLYMKCVFPRMEGEVKVGDIVQTGFALSNGEWGNAATVLDPIFWRAWCDNGCSAPVKGVRKVHTGGRTMEGVAYRDSTLELADKADLAQLEDALTSFASKAFLDEMLEKLQASTEGEQIQRPVEAVEVLSKSFGMNDTEKNSVLTSLIKEGDLSRWGVLNAVTQVANTHESYDRATEFEDMGGKVLNLNQSQWREIAMAA